MTTEAYVSFEHAGVLVEIVQDDDPGYGPQENDNAGTIYSWTPSFDGDERIHEPDLQVDDSETWDEDPRWRVISLDEFMRTNYDAALTVPLFFSDYGSPGARIYQSDDPNCAICFTQKEIDHEWSGHIDPYSVTRENGEVVEYGGARKYAEARINELDQWFRGEVYGIVIRDPETNEVMESVWGFIDDQVWTENAEKSYTISEARSMAEGCAAQITREKSEAFRWACADVVTV